MSVDSNQIDDNIDLCSFGERQGDSIRSKTRFDAASSSPSCEFAKSGSSAVWRRCDRPHQSSEHVYGKARKSDNQCPQTVSMRNWFSTAELVACSFIQARANASKLSRGTFQNGKCQHWRQRRDLAKVAACHWQLPCHADLVLLQPFPLPQAKPPRLHCRIIGTASLEVNSHIKRFHTAGAARLLQAPTSVESIPSRRLRIDNDPQWLPILLSPLPSSRSRNLLQRLRFPSNPLLDERDEKEPRAPRVRRLLRKRGLLQVGGAGRKPHTRDIGSGSWLCRKCLGKTAGEQEPIGRARIVWEETKRKAEHEHLRLSPMEVHKRNSALHGDSEVAPCCRSCLDDCITPFPMARYVISKALAIRDNFPVWCCILLSCSFPPRPQNIPRPLNVCRWMILWHPRFRGKHRSAANKRQRWIVPNTRTKQSACSNSESPDRGWSEPKRARPQAVHKGAGVKSFRLACRL